MKTQLQRAAFAVVTVIVVTLSVAAWNTRPLAAQEPPMDPSYGAWCQRVHAELFSMLPQRMQQHLMAMHARHME
jgi:hypothetical protein